MATWATPLPKNGDPILVGDPDHDVIHTHTVDCIEELRDVVDAVEATIPTVPAAPTVDTLSGATATGRSVMKAASTAAARTAIGAGTSDLAVGPLVTDAKAGNYVPAWADVSGKPTTFAPITGTAANQAAPGNHTHTATAVTATAVAPGTATDVQGILAELASRITALEEATP